MKKIATYFLILGILSSCILTGSCNSASVKATIETSVLETEIATEESITDIIFEGYPATYTSLQKLLEMSDLVFVGTVTEMPPVVRIDRFDNNLPGVTESEKEYSNVTTSFATVAQVVKGDLTTGEIIKIDQYGGLADGVNEIWEGLLYPKEGTKYLMFVRSIDGREKEEYFAYTFVGTYDGFSEIVDGKIIPQENTSLFKKGAPIDDVLNSITVAVEEESTIPIETTDTAQ